jgi:hypothetical protein
VDQRVSSLIVLAPHNSAMRPLGDPDDFQHGSGGRVRIVGGYADEIRRDHNLMAMADGQLGDAERTELLAAALRALKP